MYNSIRYIFITIFLLTFGQAEQIKNYEVNVTLEKSGAFRVVESIDYDFNATTSKHGIYREIPSFVTKENMQFNIGLENFSVLMDGKRVEHNISQNTTDGWWTIRIGDAKTYVSGVHRYTIAYRCTNAIFPSTFSNKSKDMLTWTAIGSGWDVPISNINVHLFLPQLLNKSSVNVKYPFVKEYWKWVDEQHIVFQKEYMNPNSQFYFTIVFPRGLLLQNGKEKIEKAKEAEYREKQLAEKVLKSIEKKHQEEVERQDSIFWGIFALLILFVWHKREDWGIETEVHEGVVVRYRPPSGLSVLQSGVLLDRAADMQDYSAAILELANLGMLKIEEKKEHIVLQKIDKSGEKLTFDQEKLYEAIFKEGERFAFSEEKGIRKHRFSLSLRDINHALYIWAVEEGYAKENFAVLRKKIAKKVLLAWIVILPAMLYATVWQYGNIDNTLDLLANTFAAFLPGIVFAFYDHPLKRKILVTLGGLGFWIFLMSMPLGLFKKVDITAVELLTSPMAIVGWSIVLGLVFMNSIAGLTPKGKDVVYLLRGFEYFMKRVKADEIKRRLEEDPLYLEKTLPYAMLFGKVTHWMSLYDTLHSETPKWHTSRNTSFSRLVNHFAQEAKSMTYVKQHSISYKGVSGSTNSSTSSGHSSGGSVGGGGGGSW